MYKAITVIALLISVSSFSQNKRIRLDSVQAVHKGKTLITGKTQSEFIRKFDSLIRKKRLPVLTIKNFYSNRANVEYKITLKK